MEGGGGQLKHERTKYQNLTSRGYLFSESDVFLMFSPCAEKLSGGGRTERIKEKCFIKERTRGDQYTSSDHSL